jgi:hypothetical protein
MEIKEIYTREEATLMSLVSSLIGSTPHTFQGESAYWDLVGIDFKEKVINFTVSDEFTDNLYYSMAGVASIHGYIFEELF